MSFILYYVSFGYYNPYPVEKPKSKYTFTINDDYINIRKNESHVYHTPPPGSYDLMLTELREVLRKRELRKNINNKNEQYFNDNK